MPTPLVMLLLFPAIGAVSGLLAGLFGIGGGLVIVPALNAAFVAGLVAVDPAIRMHVAIGSSLAVIVFTALSSVRAHHGYRAVLWPVVLGLAPGIVVGGLLGAALADALATRALELWFGAFVLLMAAQLALAPRVQAAGGAGLPGPGRNLAAGTGIGAVSALAGIGGGIMTVPYLAWHGVPLHQAVGTAAACTLPVALSGAVGYALAGQGAGTPAFSTGYLFWPAVLGIAVAAILTAPLGAQLAHRLPVRQLRILFAVLLVVVAADMLRG
ncbi:sulfite exporter TauE/SafE family protein [Thioalkalivibrio sp. XN8]|uniref:sulfite exporter TauE/SafE family protein n=1 Tax=Thioalkalivibrio sp. XN8 TaxID=2712863 RepID=UPI0013EDFFA8|nr:sulfite exporter TauE/SafE family protein [Thioalkalivibrio sp. XN8]NGP52790.1 sulfite exporter TauE/SafE family protein [Thioalkalivibrio sp. XN8]